MTTSGHTVSGHTDSGHTDSGHTVSGHTVAAVDCGTNSTRLLVAAADGSTVERLLTITRLGQGVDATGRLAAEAIDRTVEALRRYRTVMDSHGVVAGRLVATSAARDASNYAEFCERAREASGLELEILDGVEEGTLSFLGATAGLDAEPRRLVVDIGGGSTELIAGRPGSPPRFVTSIDMGCVRMTEKFLHGDPPLSSEVQALRSRVGELLGAERDRARANYVADAFDGHGLVGVAGTVTALSAMSLGLAVYDPAAVHHSVLTRIEVERLAGELAGETVDQRHHHRSLEPGRADVIAAGAAILGTLMHFLDFEALLVSESDILDGMVASLLGAP